MMRTSIVALRSRETTGRIMTRTVQHLPSHASPIETILTPPRRTRIAAQVGCGRAPRRRSALFNPSGGNMVRRIVFAVAATLVLPAIALAQTWKPSAESQRCPSKWGAGDERGSGNHMKAETVLKATRLIRTGEVIELGHVLSPTMPFSGNRPFDVHTKRRLTNQISTRAGR